ncbi:MAG: cytochrome c [Planctomycetes bacterium]|nr:cytochrome c [Planctomycetota bacterium]
MKSVFWAVLVFAAIYLFLSEGVAPLTERLTGTAAPLPASLVLLYGSMTGLGILLFLSVNEERWRRFLEPIQSFLREADHPSAVRRWMRKAFLGGTPLALALWAYARAAALPDPPADPPGIHFTQPEKYSKLSNPVEPTEENIRQGGILYTRNCAPCHGDGQDGSGIFARAWQPRPANFRDVGTIQMLQENYLFWRIKEGGPGVPRGSIEYRSAMPVWGPVLKDDEIWKIILYEYRASGTKPREMSE